MNELGVEDLFDLPLGFSYYEIRRRTREVGVLRIFVVRIQFGYIPDGVDILPVAWEFEPIGVGANLLRDFERSGISFGKFSGWSVEGKVAVIQ